METPHNLPSASPRRTTDSRINCPIHFVSGPFEGKTIRAELREIQKADLGRKYARVDRRPLDPPPVVHLRLYQVYNCGTDAQREEEIPDYSDVQTLGLLCGVDLFTVPLEAHDSAQTPGRDPRHSLYIPDSDSIGASARQPFYHSYHATQHLRPPHPNTSTQTMFGPHRSNVVTRPITEDMMCTTSLSGATFVQPATIEYEGRKALVFAFADLAVKIEGQFLLRYRCFDIFAHVSEHGDMPIQSECYGGPFKIYSTKEFPGLQPSTELTKQLARWGVRLNTRETERRRGQQKGDRVPGGSVSASVDMNRRQNRPDQEI